MGCVLDMGNDASFASVVYEGYVVPHAVVRSPQAGLRVTEALATLLAANSNRDDPLGCISNEYARLELSHHLKEDTCVVAPLPFKSRMAFVQTQYMVQYQTVCNEDESGGGRKQQQQQQPQQQQQQQQQQPRRRLKRRVPPHLLHHILSYVVVSEQFTYEMPDGNLIIVSGQDRVAGPEVLFRGAGSVQSIVHEAIQKVDTREIRAVLYRNIVLCGGTSCLAG